MYLCINFIYYLINVQTRTVIGEAAFGSEQIVVICIVGDLDVVTWILLVNVLKECSSYSIKSLCFKLYINIYRR